MPVCTCSLVVVGDGEINGEVKPRLCVSDGHRIMSLLLVGMVSVVALALATDRMPRFHFGFPSLQDSADSSVDDSVNVIPLARIVKQHTKYVPPLLIARYFDPPLAIPSWRDLDFSPQSSCEK